MNMNKTVSVIVPIFNAEQTLTRCIKSILQQTYTHIEVILINDGSTDGSQSLCESWARKDQRIHVFHQENKGVSAARNYGLKVVTGDYIQFVDADDWIEPHMTNELVSEMTEQHQLVICGYTAVRPKQAKQTNISYLPHLSGTFSQPLFLKHIGALYKQIILPSPCNKLYQTDMIRNYHIRFREDIHLGEDLLFNLDYIHMCQSISVINQSLYNYTIEGNDSLSTKFHHDYFDQQYFLHVQLKDFLEKNDHYDGENKLFIQMMYANHMINGLTNLFHNNSVFTNKQKKDKISHMINDDFIRQHLPYFKDTLQSRLIGFLIKKRHAQLLYYFLKSKHMLRQHMSPFFTLLKRMNH